MKTRICVLAALLAVAGTAWADKTAYFTARYGGWSKEPSCDNTANGRRCWVMTLGKGKWNHEAAGLTYTCRADGEEWFNFDFWATGVVSSDGTSLPVRWDGGHEESLVTWLETSEYRGKPLYWFNISDPQTFLARAVDHDRITVTLPYKDGQGRFEKAKFPMKRVLRSIKEALEGCGLERSSLAEILNQ